MTRIHMDTEAVRETARLLNRTAGELDNLPSKLKNLAGSISSAWQGGRSGNYANELRKVGNALQQEVANLQRLAAQVGNEVNEWEDADNNGPRSFIQTSGLLFPGVGILTPLLPSTLIFKNPSMPQWRGVLSNRLDDVPPVEPGGRSTLNSLREANVGWQEESGRLASDIGRLNVRNGPGYGFNPTDSFRDGASRAVTTADPLALRENRLVTVMLRAQQLWDGGNVSLTLAPKLRDRASQESFSLDLGASNHADRALLAMSAQPSGQVSLQLFAFHESNKGLQLGANATALLGDSVVGFAECGLDLDRQLQRKKPRQTAAMDLGGRFRRVVGTQRNAGAIVVQGRESDDLAAGHLHDSSNSGSAPKVQPVKPASWAAGASVLPASTGASPFPGGFFRAAGASAAGTIFAAWNRAAT